MFFRNLIALLVLTCGLLLPYAARADASLLHASILPSIVPRLPPSQLTGAAITKASTTSTGAPLVPVDHGFFASVGRLLDGMRPSAAESPRDATWRNPSLRDPARDRDATSFGIRSASMSPSGTAFAGAGVAAGAAQLLDVAKVGKSVPVKVAPSMCQGGGGITLKLPW